MTSSEELTKVNGEVTPLSADLESLKQEIFREMRKEMSRLKLEIIDGEYFCVPTHLSLELISGSSASKSLDNLLVLHFRKPNSKYL